MIAIREETPIETQIVEDEDDQLIAMWIHGRSPHTARSYIRDADRLRRFVAKPLRAMSLRDLQAFADSLEGEASSRARALASIKSLFSFGVKLGYLPFNVGAALQMPKVRDGLADRIIGAEDVQRLLAVTRSSPRDHAIVRLLYASGMRVSELIGLRWIDVVSADNGDAFVTVFGKGGKTRTVRISARTRDALEALRSPNAIGEDYVFAGQSVEGHIAAWTAWKIVRNAGRAAGLDREISPHFMRHAHASHAIDAGAKITVVRDTLGHASVAVTDRYAHARPGESSGAFLAV
jgi:integrase/recombinase XerD